jgi:hypothetical protein
MIGLKSGMMRSNHANKWHDLSQKEALRQRSQHEIVLYLLKHSNSEMNLFFNKKRLQQG